ncbi:MAG: hypothetical protein CME61_09690 [Halobacteriovoraceae bacterium]|nr:hypothetical protein [Halobacteriovoraceae bacterium]|tara:strand:+ start:1092 stop:1808 length:717 start_codon:yes stop_codon:yes gene_type:complete
MSLSTFRQLHSDLNLSHHPFKRSFNYLKWAFKSINFNNKTVLDIGGGNGIYSYYSRYSGAKKCINLEPFEAGSKNVKINSKSVDDNLKIEIINDTIQDFNTKEKFDIIILHDSINHLNEPIFSNLHKSEKDFKAYCDILNKISNLLKSDGVIIVTDCSRYNFWGFIGLKSPFAPSIDWDIHQSPYLIKKLFKIQGFDNHKIRWSPFKRFGLFGRILSFCGFLPSFFMQSHFNIVFKKH